MKLKFAVFTLILAIAPPLIAQKLTSDSLVITGSIEKVDAYYEDKCTVRMLVYLQFRNDGNVPLIFFNPSRFLIKRVRFANNETGDPTERVVSVDSFVQGMRARDFSESAYYAETIKSINRPEPPRTIVQPGFTYEFTDELIVDSGFQCEKSNGEARRDRATPLPRYPSFKVRYYLPLNKYDDGREILRILQARWKPSGYLLLDDDGNIAYETKEIIFPNFKQKP